MLKATFMASTATVRHCHGALVVDLVLTQEQAISAAIELLARVPEHVAAEQLARALPQLVGEGGAS